MGRILPPKTVFRLTPKQRMDLNDVLGIHPLTASLVQAIEASVDAYQRTRSSRELLRDDRLKKRIAEARRADGLVRQLRSVLPLATDDDFWSAILPPAADDEPLIRILDARLSRWEPTFAWIQRMRKRGRPAHTRDIRLGLEILQALHQQNIPLNDGRGKVNGVVVDVIGLIRQWGSGDQQRPPYRRTSADYKFTKMLVDIYHRTQPDR